MNPHQSRKGMTGISLLVVVVVALIVLAILFWGPIKSIAEGFLHIENTKTCKIVAGEGNCKSACAQDELEFSFGCTGEELCCVPRESAKENEIANSDTGTAEPT